MMSYVSLIDATLITLVLVSGMILWKTVSFLKKLDKNKVYYTLLITLIIAIIIEYRGVYLLNKWQYSSLMPVIFGVGLSPLVQLAITGLISFFIVQRLLYFKIL